MRRVLAWLGAPWWLVALVPFGVAASLAPPAFCVTWDPLWPGWPVVAARGAMVVGAVPVAQIVVRAMRARLGELFAVDPGKSVAADHWPPPIVGAAENLLFPLTFLALGPTGGTAVGAWIALKTLGNWKSWQTGSTEDPHKGRRLMYLFILCNAWQVLAGVAVAWAMAGVR